MCNFGLLNMIPLILRLKKTVHKEIAKAQDMIVETLYQVFNDAVIHGGTGIWRCYQGNRFSEDVDVYLPEDLHKVNLLFDLFGKKGFIIKKKKIGENSIYSTLSINGVIVRFEALFKKIKGSLKEYETVEGNFITIYTLTPEEFVKEKVDAYLKRFKVRDLYDIFFLLRYTKKANLKEKLEEFLKKFKNPLDEKDLRVLILEGIVPDVDQIIAYIKRSL